MLHVQIGSGVLSKVNYNFAEQPPGSQCVLYTYPPDGIYLGRDVPYRQYSSILTTIEYQRGGTTLFVQILYIFTEMQSEQQYLM